MKKIIALLFAVVLAFSMTACKGKEKTSAVDSTELDLGDYSGQTLEVTAIDKGYGYAWLADAARVFNKATGSRITVKGDETLNESIARTLQVGTNVSDVYFTISTNLQWIEWATKGYIVDISDTVPDDRFVSEQTSRLGIYNGKRYYYPFSAPPTGFVYNKDYLDRIPSSGEYTQGKFPETWQGLLDLCQATVDANIKNNGVQVMPFCWGATVSDIIYLFSGMWASMDEDGYRAYWDQNDLSADKTQSNRDLFVNENVKKVIENIYALFNPKQNAKGNYYPSFAVQDATGQNNLEAEETFLNGYALFTLTGSWFETEMADIIEDMEADFYHFAPVPSQKSGSKTATHVNYGEYFCVTGSGKNANIPLAKAFLAYVLSEESCERIHSALQTPLAYTYDISKVNLNGWGREIAEAAENSINAVAASDTLVFLSGALNMDLLSTPFRNMATRAACNADEIMENFYSTQINDWDTRLKNLDPDRA